MKSNRVQRISSVGILILISTFAIVSFQNCSPLPKSTIGISHHTGHPDDSAKTSYVPVGTGGKDLWITPNFTAHDFSSFLETGNISQWINVYSRANIFKFYLAQGNPSDVTFPGADALKIFGQKIRQDRKGVAVEVGGLYITACQNNTRSADGHFEIGKVSAEFEWNFGVSFLNEKLGGIDYLVLDGPFIRILSEEYRAACGNPEPVEVARQITYYMKAMKQKMPNVQFVLLSNFPNWPFKGVPAKNPNVVKNLDYADIFNLMMDIAQEQGVQFQGLQIDNPYDYLTNEADWNRLAQINQMARQKGLRTSVILNTDRWTHWTRDNPKPNANDVITPTQAFESQRFVDESALYYQTLKQKLISFDGFAVQSWYRTPFYILPESNPGTFMNAALRVMQLGLEGGLPVPELNSIVNPETCTPAEYFARRPDVAASGMTALYHYNLAGRNEGMCQPIFSNAVCTSEIYLAQRPDVAAAGMTAVYHYNLAGKNEGMCHPQ